MTRPSAFVAINNRSEGRGDHLDCVSLSDFSRGCCLDYHSLHAGSAPFDCLQYPCCANDRGIEQIFLRIGDIEVEW